MNQIEDFMYTVKSDRTKTTYKEYLKYFEAFSKISVTKLLEKSMKPKDIENILIKYVKHMRDKGLSNSSIKGRIAPLITILELNDKVVNKRKIKKYYGEEKKTVKDLAYSREDIERMLSVAKLRSKVIILIYSSTAIRRDAIIDLKVKHLEKIEEYGLYKFTIYENSKEEYVTFCTPECATMIDLYLRHREQSGEVINKESYLVRNDFNYTKKDMSRNVKPITSDDLSTLFRNLLLKTGLRAENQRMYGRHQKAIFHAYRKFWTGQAIKSNMNPEVREMLLSHKIGLASVYYKPTEKEMLKEYLKAVNNLTIDAAYKWKAKYEENKIDNEILQKHEEEIKVILRKMEKRDEILKELSANINPSKIRSKFLRIAQTKKKI